MPTARPQLRDSDLAPNAHRMVLAGAIEDLRYPGICPNCGAPADTPLAITKVFQYNHGNNDDAGWKYRLAQAAPLFCPECIARHQAEALPVTAADKLKSALLTELALPGLGTAAFAIFLLQDKGARYFGDLQRHWPVLAFIGGLLFIAVLCLWMAWTGNAHRRVPRQTETSRAFDFGDDDTSSFQTTGRTYAIRDGNHAAALGRLNAERSAGLLGPAQRKRERRTFWMTAAIIAALAVAGYHVVNH